MSSLKTAYELALERSAGKTMTQTSNRTPQKRPFANTNLDFFVGDTPQNLKGSRLSHPPPKTEPEEEKRENPVEHRNIYAVKSYQELLNRLRGGQLMQIRNERMGYLAIKDLGIALKLGQVLDLTRLPWKMVLESNHLRDLCEHELVTMEGRFE